MSENISPTSKLIGLKEGSTIRLLKIITKGAGKLKTDIYPDERTIDSINTRHYSNQRACYNSNKGSVSKSVHRRIISHRLPELRSKHCVLIQKSIKPRFNEFIYGQCNFLFNHAYLRDGDLKKASYKRKVIEETKWIKKRFSSVNTRKLALPNNSSYHQIVNFVNDIKNISKARGGNIVSPQLSPLKSFLVSSRSTKAHEILLRYKKGCNLRSILLNRENKGLVNISITDPIRSTLPASLENKNVNLKHEGILNIQENVFLYPDLKSHAIEKELNIAIHDPFYIVNSI